jgi:NitT/TauT family transport system substrate-binding protein
MGRGLGTRRVVVTALVAALAVSVTACGDDGDDTTASAEGGAADEGTSGATGADGESMSVRFMQLGESLTWMPFLVARGQNCYAENDLDVEWVSGPPNAQQATQALEQGEADVLAVGTTGFLSALAANRDVVAFGAGAKGDTSLLVLRNDVVERLAEDGVTPDSPLEDRMEALRGLTIAANTAGGPVMLATEAALREFGLEGEVELQALDGPAAMVGALQAGQIDGFVYSPPPSIQPVVSGVGQVWINGPAGDVDVWQTGYYWVYITKPSYAEENAEVLRTIIDCVAEASELLATDPDAAAAAAREFFPSLEDDIYTESFDALIPVFVDGPEPSEEGFQESVDRFTETSGTEIDRPFSEAFVDLDS